MPDPAPERAAPATAAAGKIKVLIVDDSALVRRTLQDLVNRQPDMTVVGTAPEPYAAREMIRERNPDVVTLDVEMPRMDGIEFLEKLMRLRPMPVVMVSTLTEKGADVTMRALELGAVDFVAKPKLDIAQGIEAGGAEIVEKIRTAARAKVRRVAVSPRPPDAGAVHMLGTRASTEKLIIIGASTGGTEAIKHVLTQLPPDSPGVLITQHMPAGFTQSFARRLDSLCRIRVREAEHNERVLPGHAYIAPGDRHLAVKRSGANYVAVLTDDPPVNRHRPSVEVLFQSAARHVGPNAIGIMLTGMGKDGARAMREMRDAGSYNVAQDEATCVVFGMPKEAIAAGAVQEILPVGSIAGHVIGKLSREGEVRHRV